MAMTVTLGGEALTFNAADGFAEAIVRGYRGGLLTDKDYANLTQCETLDDVKLHLGGTDYGECLQNEPSPLAPSTIVERGTEKLVAEFNYLRSQASERLAAFLDFCTYGYMIDNVVLIVTGTLLHDREMQELLDKCHPLGMFDSIATLAVAQNMRELYRLVLVDTPLAPYFSQCVSLEDMDEMNIEVMRNLLYKAYLEDFLRFCRTLGGTTAALMEDMLEFEADRRAVNITINSIGTELTRDDRERLYCNFGSLYPHGHTELKRCEDEDQVRALMERVPAFAPVTERMGYGESGMLDKHFFEEEAKRCVLTFETQFNYAVFYSYLKLREMELRNLLWLGECIAQDQKARVSEGVVAIL
mmetsp:Transcript_8845/g.29100  ORF Transcript_8845/g.29100 Transcript_8845/m.29100 type:complete len:358 (+) Transcript_8845:39-1112(+)